MKNLRMSYLFRERGMNLKLKKMKLTLLFSFYDKLPVEEFGQTESQINSLIAPIYRTLKDLFPSNYFLLSECSSDMAITPTRKGGDWWEGSLKN